VIPKLCLTNNRSAFLQTIENAIKGEKLMKAKPKILTKSLIRSLLSYVLVAYTVRF